MAGIRRAFLPSLLLAMAFATACSGEGDSAKKAAPDQGSSEEGARVQAVSAQADLQDREVIYTADLVVRVGAVGDATSRAVRIARDEGGLVFGQDSDLEGEREARLTFKVPPDRFDAVLDSLADLGRVLRQQVSAQDVTEQVVDLEGRLKTAQASADRLRALLAGAETTADVVAIEGELAKRESEIESLQGQLRVLTSQIELATIELHLTERGDVEVSEDLPGFLQALRAGWVALVTVGIVVAAVVGFLLPFLPLAVLVWWLVRLFWRRHLRKPPRATAPPAAGLPPPPPR